MLPKERTALLCVAGVTRLVDRFLDEELRARRAVDVVTAGTGHFSFQDRMPRVAMNLGILGLVTLGADTCLGQRIQHSLLWRMQLVAIGTGNAVHFMLAARPVRPGTDARFVTIETGCIPLFCRRKLLGLGSEHDIRRLAARIALVVDTGAVTRLTTRSASVGLHAMLGLVDGEYRRTPILIMADGALLVPFQGPVDLCHCGYRADEYRSDGAD